MVKKTVLVASILVLSILAIVSAAADFNKDKVLISKVYGPGDILKGSLNMTLKDYPADAMLTLAVGNLVKKIPLSDFLRANNLSFDCNPENCISYYTTSNNDTTKILNGTNYLAFIAYGDNVTIDSLAFNIQGELDITPECGNSPLILDLLNDNSAEWKYLEAGDGFCGSLKPSDYYSAADASYNYLIKSAAYCEKIRLPIASKFKLAADLGGVPNDVFIKISIGDSKYNSGASCTINGTGMQSCDVNFISLEEKDYAICIKAEDAGESAQNSTYKIKGEKIPSNCGFVGSIGACSDSTIDFGLYAQPANFAPFSYTETFDASHFYGTGALKQYMQDYLTHYYSNSCTQEEGCIIPLKVSSTQNITFSNLQFVYIESAGVNTVKNDFYDAVKNSAIINLNSTQVKIEKTGFTVPIINGTYDYNISLADSLIDSGSLIVARLPTISLYPLNASASISQKFFATADDIIAYYWDFGDGSYAATNLSSTAHTYQSSGEYILKITVTTSKKLNVTQSFNIEVMQPKDFVNKSLAQKTAYLNNLQKDLDAMPSWYKSIATEQMDLANLKRVLASYQTQFLDPTTDIASLKGLLENFIVYTGIKDEDLGQSPILQSVDLSLLEKAGAGSVPENSDAQGKLQQNINNWQYDINIKADGIVKIAESENAASSSDLLTLITLEISADSPMNKVFLIIKNLANAKFPENTSEQEIDGSVLFVFDELKDKQTIEFAIPSRFNPTDLEIITSPEFNSFTTQEYFCGNQICEAGEDYNNCPEDCPKPSTNKIVYVIIFVLIMAAGLYWIWKFYARSYEKKLEEKLFKNKADLYNLTFFITRAMNKGEKEADIGKKLTEAGWQESQVSHAMQKIKKERRLVQLNTLINFISIGIRNGKSEDVLKAELKSAGWQDRDINNAYKKTLEMLEKEKKKFLNMQKQKAKESKAPRKK